VLEVVSLWLVVSLLEVRLQEVRLEVRLLEVAAAMVPLVSRGRRQMELRPLRFLPHLCPISLDL
jgi:hypothetical protein